MQGEYPNDYSRLDFLKYYQEQRKQNIESDSILSYLHDYVDKFTSDLKESISLLPIVAGLQKNDKANRLQEALTLINNPNQKIDYLWIDSNKGSRNLIMKDGNKIDFTRDDIDGNATVALGDIDEEKLIRDLYPSIFKKREDQFNDLFHGRSLSNWTYETDGDTSNPRHEYSSSDNSGYVNIEYRTAFDPFENFNIQSLQVYDGSGHRVFGFQLPDIKFDSEGKANQSINELVKKTLATITKEK